VDTEMDLNISERLGLAGFSHARTPNAVNTMKHTITEIATGNVIGEMTVFESIEFLRKLRKGKILNEA
jgi:hypothetical protein